MNETWKNICKKYVDCYKSIETLAENGIFDEEEKIIHEHNLLFKIIQTMKFEIE